MLLMFILFLYRTNDLKAITNQVLTIFATKCYMDIKFLMMIVAYFFAYAPSGLLVILLIHRALPYAIADAPLGLYRKNPIVL